MGKKRRVHKPLPHTADEVLEAIAKGKGAKKKDKKRPQKKKQEGG